MEIQIIFSFSSIKKKSGNPIDYLIFYVLGVLPILLVFFKAF